MWIPGESVQMRYLAISGQIFYLNGWNTKWRSIYAVTNLQPEI